MITIEPGPLPKRIEVPSSKSHTLRAILLASFAKGKSHISHFLDAPDTHKVIEACRQLGADIMQEGPDLQIIGTEHPNSGTFDLGNSGIALRFLTGLLAHFEGSFHLTGDASLQRRPIEPLREALKTRHTGVVRVDGSDSQMVSALIFSALFKPLVIHVENPGETPWVALSLAWLERLGIEYENENFTKITVHGKGQIAPFSYTVPADFSSVSYPVGAALLLRQEVEIPHLDFSDPQGDKHVLNILEKMGARFEKVGHLLRVLKNDGLRGCNIDINPVIDALPLFAVMGTFATGKTTLVNGAIARTKECDRISCICEELKKMGAKIEEHRDGLTIWQSRLHGAALHSHGDQRLVFALSLAALIAEGTTTISEYLCYTKTFPSFFSALKLIK